MKHVIALILILLFPLGFSAHAGSAGNDIIITGTTPSGNWSGNWVSSIYTGARGPVTISMTKTGRNVTGTASIGNTECGTLSAPISGSESGGTISLNANFNVCGYIVPFAMVISSSMGYSETGSYALYYQNGSIYDQGIWTIYRQTPATVSLIASAGQGVTISPSGFFSIDYKASQTFTITAQSGYTLSDVLVDGSSVGVRSSYTFYSVTEGHTINAVATRNPAPQPNEINLAPIIDLLLSN